MNCIQILLRAQKECAKENTPESIKAVAKLHRVIYYLEYGITRYYDRVYPLSTGDLV